MINLLPPAEKQLLLKERQFREVLILGILFFLTLVFLNFILGFIKIDLDSKLLFQEEILAREKKAFEASEIENLEAEVGFFNLLLSKLDSFYQKKFYLTDVLENLSKTMPSGLYLINFSYNKVKGEISISGFSPNREILSEFKTNLEKEETFKDVYFPASNWVKPVDIDFFVRFEISNN